ncbi:Conserved_hypothetical protein [Hexamita inflata]|uniref:GRIP domain-containing protein n=1 Tax=Hexamita inflata TaxID=28002 RepID=A0ABP1HBL9_9EUKA
MNNQLIDFKDQVVNENQAKLIENTNQLLNQIQEINKTHLEDQNAINNLNQQIFNLKTELKQSQNQLQELKEEKELEMEEITKIAHEQILKYEFEAQKLQFELRNTQESEKLNIMEINNLKNKLLDYENTIQEHKSKINVIEEQLKTEYNQNKQQLEQVIIEKEQLTAEKQLQMNEIKVLQQQLEQKEIENTTLKSNTQTLEKQAEEILTNTQKEIEVKVEQKVEKLNDQLLVVKKELEHKQHLESEVSDMLRQIIDVTNAKDDLIISDLSEFCPINETNEMKLSVIKIHENMKLSKIKEEEQTHLIEQITELQQSQLQLSQQLQKQEEDHMMIIKQKDEQISCYMEHIDQLIQNQRQQLRIPSSQTQSEAYLPLFDPNKQIQNELSSEESAHLIQLSKPLNTQQNNKIQEIQLKLQEQVNLINCKSQEYEKEQHNLEQTVKKLTLQNQEQQWREEQLIKGLKDSLEVTKITKTMLSGLKQFTQQQTLNVIDEIVELLSHKLLIPKQVIAKIMYDSISIKSDMLLIKDVVTQFNFQKSIHPVNGAILQIVKNNDNKFVKAKQAIKFQVSVIKNDLDQIKQDFLVQSAKYLRQTQNSISGAFNAYLQSTYFQTYKIKTNVSDISQSLQRARYSISSIQNFQVPKIDFTLFNKKYASEYQNVLTQLKSIKLQLSQLKNLPQIDLNQSQTLLKSFAEHHELTVFQLKQQLNEQQKHFVNLKLEHQRQFSLKEQENELTIKQLEEQEYQNKQINLELRKQKQMLLEIQNHENAVANTEKELNHKLLNEINELKSEFEKKTTEITRKHAHELKKLQTDLDLKNMAQKSLELQIKQFQNLKMDYQEDKKDLQTLESANNSFQTNYSVISNTKFLKYAEATPNAYLLPSIAKLTELRNTIFIELKRYNALNAESGQIITEIYGQISNQFKINLKEIQARFHLPLSDQKEYIKATKNYILQNWSYPMELYVLGLFEAENEFGKYNLKKKIKQCFSTLEDESNIGQLVKALLVMYFMHGCKTMQTQADSGHIVVFPELTNVQALQIKL